MKTLRKYVVNGGLFAGDGITPAAVGDQVRLYLDTEAHNDFPEYITGTIQHPAAPLNGGTAVSYSFEYNEDDIDGIVANLIVADVISVEVFSAVDVVAAALDAEVTARTAADSAHEADTTAHPASSIVNTPAGTISATTVQGAINELDARFTPLSLEFTPDHYSFRFLEGDFTGILLVATSFTNGRRRYTSGIYVLEWTGTDWELTANGVLQYSASSDVPYPEDSPDWGVDTEALQKPGILGQPAIVTHSDATQTEWGCVDTSPMTWLPRTAGVVKNRATGQWERTFIQDSTIQTEILPNQ